MGPSPGHERFHSMTSGNLQHRHKQPSLGVGNIGVERWCFRTANVLGLQKWGHFPPLHRQALGQVLGKGEQRDGASPDTSCQAADSSVLDVFREGLQGYV